MNLLRSPDPAEGDPAPPTPTVTPPAPPPPGPSQPPPAAPPAAAAVVQGRSEREIELSAELEKERKAHATTADEKKQREQRINELEDERRRLLDANKPPRAKAQRVRLTFFDEGD